MAVGINRQAVLDELGNPVPQNTGVSGYGRPGGLPTPPLAQTAAPPLQPGGGGMPQVPVAPGTDRLSVGMHRAGPVDPGEMANYQRTMGDINARDKGLGMWDQAGYAAVNRDREAANRAFFGAGYQMPGAGGGATDNQPPLVNAPPALADNATPAATGAYNMRGFDAGKLAGGGDSEKYKIGRIMQRYDPRGGVTPQMLAELNALGIAEFSGQGDKLTVNNTKNDPRFGTGGTADVVYGLKGNNADTAWQPWFMDEGGASGGGGQVPGQPGQVSGGANPGLAMAQSNLSGLLQGDPYSALQQALGRTQQPNLQALIAQLGGQ